MDGLPADEYKPRRIPLRGCHPRDLIGQALSIADHLGESGRLTVPLLKMAFHPCFVEGQSSVAVPSRPAEDRKH